MSDDIADTNDSAPLGATVWEKILQEREQAATDEARKKAETLGRGKRKRTTVDYSAHEELSPVKKPRGREAENDVEFKDVMAESESDSEPDLQPGSDEVVREAKKPKGSVISFLVTDLTVANMSCSTSLRARQPPGQRGPCIRWPGGESPPLFGLQPEPSTWSLPFETGRR